MKKYLRRDNWGLWFLGALLILILIAARDEKTQIYTSCPHGYTELVPTLVQETEKGNRTIYLNVAECDDVNNTLLFYTQHQIVDVYADGLLIYSLQISDSIFGHTTGAVWNSFEIPIETEQLKIVLKPIYKGVGMNGIKFQYGNGVHMFTDMVIATMSDIVICLVIFCLGIFFCLYWLSIFFRSGTQKEVLYFGLFCLIFGIWSFGETYLGKRLITDRGFASYLAFTCLMSMAVPFVLFVREFFKLHKSKAHRYVLGYLVVSCSACQILHLTGILGVKQTAPVTLLNIIMGIVYLIYCLAVSWKKGLAKRTTRVHLLGLAFLIFFGMIDAVMYFLEHTNANLYSKVGILVYIVIWGTEMAHNAQKKLREAQTMEIYKEMAEMDMLTGCYNRNAYSEDVQTAQTDDLMMLAFDLNDLKKHNDTYGHIAGDQYIIDASAIICRVFGHLGKVYRVGGDEFCLMVQSLPEEKMKELRGTLEKEVQSHSEAVSDPDFGIAFGYAVYDKDLDKNMEDTRNRADVSMYKNKREMKDAN